MIKSNSNIIQSFLFKIALILVAALFAAAIALDIAFSPSFSDSLQTVHLESDALDPISPTSFQLNLDHSPQLQFDDSIQSAIFVVEFNFSQYFLKVLEIRSYKNQSHQSCHPLKSPEGSETGLFA